MDQDFFMDLLKRYGEGKATPEEIRFLEAYYKSFEINQNATDGMSKHELEKLAANIRKGIVPVREASSVVLFRRAWRKGSRFAAAAVIALICGLILFRYHKVERQSLAVEEKAQQVLPSNTNNFIQLPDGSIAILTPGSTLDYPNTFEGAEKREVTLKGEAYFDVEHVPLQPFVVLSGSLKTTVLGTTFNVKAIPDSESILVTVISGKVQVGNEKETFAILLPDEQMVYHVPEGKKSVRTIQPGGLTEWVREDLYCDDITVGQAATLIEQRYGVVVEVLDSTLRSKRFTTTFTKNETLISVLNSLTLFNDAVYTNDISKNKIILSPNPI
jgi:transmembrane sensor